ncbi:unnamed protein product [Effrenium voratum]|uniref:Uncharacterized protein n=1 Tax=Effrenium voratum TaxID=2562239 RepID=A0AA36J0W0_9DINO|nr:unnamed protein product [Effrenium voratum]
MLGSLGRAAFRPRRLPLRSFAARRMILDMDGVLYKNSQVEKAIVHQLERQCGELGIGHKCQELYESHGSTMRGLISEGFLAGDIEAFYRRVYDAVDTSALRSDPLLARQLENLGTQVDFTLASNSPRFFVERVLQALGVSQDLFGGSAGIVCPEAANGWLNKPDPRYFAQLPPGVLFDDAVANCDAAMQVPGLSARRVGREEDVMMLVADELGVVPASWRLSKFDYLQAKERADHASLGPACLQRLKQELAEMPGPLAVLDLGCGGLSMLPVLLEQLPGREIAYTAVDKDEQLLQCAQQRLEATRLPTEVHVRLRCDDAVAAVAAAGQQSLVLGCSILDLLDVERLASALRTHQAGALVYFPIHYAGVTSFEGPLASCAQLLAARYDESLACRGQVTNVTELYSLLGDQLVAEASPWDLRGDDPLLRQLVSFMATNALGFQDLQDLRAAVAAISSGLQLKEELRLRVENVDFLGRVPGTAPRPVMQAGGAGDRTCVEFAAPGRVRVLREPRPQLKDGELLVTARLSGISAGTERRMLLKGPEGEALDTMMPTLQDSCWPLRYGYCLVGVDQTGRRVFCFHPHASHAAVPSGATVAIPEDVPDEDAVFFANMETAISLCQDAQPVLGDRVGLFGLGTVGMLTAALLLEHGHQVAVFDPDRARVDALLRRFPRASELAIGKAADLDVCLEVSGAAPALAQAMGVLRQRGGRLVVGSLYGGEVRLDLGLRFHRAEMTLVTSQVSRVSAPLSARWSPERRKALSWEMLRRVRPKDWIETKKVPITDACSVYQSLLQGQGPLQWIFTY